MTETKTIDLVDQYLMLKKYWEDIADKNQVRNNRQRSNVIWRHAFCVAVVERSTLTYQKIGYIINRDHATVIHALKNHESNHSFDRIYQQCYYIMSQQVNDMMNMYHKDVEEGIRKKQVDVHGNKAVQNIVDRYNQRIIRIERDHDDQLKRKDQIIQSLSKQLKNFEARNNALNKEILRVKNLL